MTDQMIDPFRKEVIEFVERNCDLSLRSTVVSEDEFNWGGRRPQPISVEATRWFEAMNDKSWIAPTWRQEHGGAGLPPEQAKIIYEEMARRKCRPPLTSLGLANLGPVLLKYGTSEQCAEHLPKIAHGEIRWCQGFSEPGAGSDLASLNCAAVRYGGDYIVSGEKIWTSHADKSDWIFCLVRTTKGENKYEGISFLLIDLMTPGISISPIKLISGASAFCSVHFDAVKVPAANLVGNEGKGWEIARFLLGHERTMYAGGSKERGYNSGLLEMATDVFRDDPDDPTAAVTLDNIVRLEIDRQCYDAMMDSHRLQNKRGQEPGSEASILKYCLSELSSRRADARHRLQAYAGLGWSGASFSQSQVDTTREWLRSRAETIVGGTSEIQLNIIARRILGLKND